MDLRTKEQRILEEIEVSGKSGFNFLVLPDINSDCVDGLISTVFGGDEVIRKQDVDMFDLLVEIGAFKSKSDAKKNWIKSDKEIPFGTSSWVVGKKRVPLFIWCI